MDSPMVSVNNVEESNFKEEDNENCDKTNSDEGPHSLPATRLKTIIGTVPNVLPVSQEGLFAFSRATELFVQELVKCVRRQYGDKVDYDELAEYILENEEFSYLHDFFPRRMTFEDALRKVNAKDRD